MSAVCIKPGIVQNICLALMGPRGWLLCQLSDHPGVAAGFGVLGRCIVPISYREALVRGPMRSLMIFGFTQVFRGTAARLRVSGVAPSKECTGPQPPRRAGQTAVGSCPDVRPSVTRVNT